MDLTDDELAGVVDLFGGLTREELDRAIDELAFRVGDADAAPGDLVDGAVDRFALVRADGLLVAGPSAFPALPEGAEDLPHILDVERRTADRTSAGTAAEQRFREAAATAVEAGDEDRLRDLLEVSYDIEAWGPVDVSDARETIDRTLED